MSVHTMLFSFNVGECVDQSQARLGPPVTRPDCCNPYLYHLHPSWVLGWDRGKHKSTYTLYTKAIIQERTGSHHRSQTFVSDCRQKSHSSLEPSRPLGRGPELKVQPSSQDTCSINKIPCLEPRRPTVEEWMKERGSTNTMAFSQP